jgi:uncharacterized protein YggE
VRDFIGGLFMKRLFIPVAILSILTMSPCLSANALMLNNDKGTITVNVTADTEIAPDTAEISFAIKTSDLSSMQKATALNKEISEKVFSELQSLIDTKKGDYIKTSDFSASPVYSYVNSKKVFEKYEVSNKVIVHTKSIDKLGSMIDNAILNGATNVDNLVFTASDYEAQCNDLISKATIKAKNRAQTVANSLSTSLNGVNNLSTSCSLNNGYSPRLYMAKNMIADTASESLSSTSTLISNGLIKLNANVNASFYVK